MPGRADAALRAAGLEERLLQRRSSRPPSAARPSTVRTACPSTWQTGHQAGVDHRAVDQHRAGAALALAAALLGAGQAEVLAQHVEQPAHAGDLDLDAARR